uniref:Uncharacterized protein n=1 Tax=uncultured bacterium BLR10 TaxID=506513 RepID=C0INS0_9BACT|nr:hypothetical protein AKSOIL_0177 [uncultured bacterium BLR10]
MCGVVSFRIYRAIIKSGNNTIKSSNPFFRHQAHVRLRRGHAGPPEKFQADMGILLAFMFIVNMIGALMLLPAAPLELQGGIKRRFFTHGTMRRGAVSRNS